MAALNGRLLKVQIDGVERAAEVSKCEVRSTPAAAERTTFQNSRDGGRRDYSLDLTFVQDAAPGSLWAQLWDSPGARIPVIVNPYGNAVPSATQPHYSGTVAVIEPDGPLLGGVADPSPAARLTVEVTWPFTGRPTKITAP